jgi:hypothetical protein
MQDDGGARRGSSRERRCGDPTESYRAVAGGGHGARSPRSSEATTASPGSGGSPGADTSWRRSRPRAIAVCLLEQSVHIPPQRPSETRRGLFRTPKKTFFWLRFEQVTRFCVVLTVKDLRPRPALGRALGATDGDLSCAVAQATTGTHRRGCGSHRTLW